MSILWVYTMCNMVARCCSNIETGNILHRNELDFNTRVDYSEDKYHLFELDLINTFDMPHSIADESVFSASQGPHFDLSLTAAP